MRRLKSFEGIEEGEIILLKSVDGEEVDKCS